MTSEGLGCSGSCDTTDVTGAGFSIACDAVAIWGLVGNGGGRRRGREVGKGMWWSEVAQREKKAGCDNTIVGGYCKPSSLSKTYIATLQQWSNFAVDFFKGKGIFSVEKF